LNSATADLVALLWAHCGKGFVGYCSTGSWCHMNRSTVWERDGTAQSRTKSEDSRMIYNAAAGCSSTYVGSVSLDEPIHFHETLSDHECLTRMCFHWECTPVAMLTHSERCSSLPSLTRMSANLADGLRTLTGRHPSESSGGSISAASSSSSSPLAVGFLLTQLSARKSRVAFA